MGMEQNNNLSDEVVIGVTLDPCIVSWIVQPGLFGYPLIAEFKQKYEDGLWKEVEMEVGPKRLG
jgi:hypothetical protein